jgi:hypothetical protein
VADVATARVIGWVLSAVALCIIVGTTTMSYIETLYMKAELKRDKKCIEKKLDEIERLETGIEGKIMLTLLSTLISFLMSGTPKILEFFQDKNDKKHELELARMQTEREMQMLAAGYAAQAKVEEIKTEQVQLETSAATTQAVIGAQQAEMQALYAHDIEIGKGASQWVTNLRASTRSILTLGFYFLLVLIDLGIFIHG